MSNKFTKGVLERQEREYKTLKTELSDDMPTPADSEDTVVPSSPPKLREPEQPIRPIGIDRYLQHKDNRKAKNKTFYLDEAVIKMLKRAASARHMTESQFVNDVLKNLLEDE